MSTKSDALRKLLGYPCHGCPSFDFKLEKGCCEARCDSARHEIRRIVKLVNSLNLKVK